MNTKPMRYLGESEAEYRQRIINWDENQTQLETQREDEDNKDTRLPISRQKMAEVITLQKLQEANNRPLLSEIKSIASGIAVVTHKPRYIAPSRSSQANILCHHIFSVCEESEAIITLLPDDLNGWRRPQYLKHVKPVEVGMRGRLYWALDIHPMGWSASDNWLFIVDASLTDEKIEQITANKGTQSEAPEKAEIGPRVGVIEGVRGVGGEVIVTVDFGKDQGSVAISMLPDEAPAKGTKGVVTKGDDGFIFTPDKEE